MELFEGTLNKSFVNKKVQVSGTTKKAVNVAKILLGARVGQACAAVGKFGSGYTFKARTTLVAQKAPFKRFRLRDGLLRLKAGKNGRGKRVFHFGILRSMMFGGEMQDTPPKRVRTIRVAVARVCGMPTFGVDPDVVWMLQRAECDPAYLHHEQVLERYHREWWMATVVVPPPMCGRPSGLGTLIGQLRSAIGVKMHDGGPGTLCRSLSGRPRS